MIGIEFNTDRSSLEQTKKKNMQYQSKINGDKSSRQQNFKVQDIENMLIHQIKKAKKLIQKVQTEIKISKKQTDGKILQQLRQIEQSIRRKNQNIKQLQLEVFSLKNGGTKQKLKPESLSFSLSEQMRSNIIATVELAKQLIQKKKHFAYRKKQVNQICQKYAVKCKAQQKQIITFTKFKQMQEKKRKQFFKLQKYRNNTKKQISSIWQQRKQLNSVNEKNENRIKQTYNHKIVAQAALKNQKKKHKQEMFNFYSKLGFLKDEDQALQSKIKTKEQQLRNAEERFNQSRNRPQAILSGTKRPLKLRTLH